MKKLGASTSGADNKEPPTRWECQECRRPAEVLGRTATQWPPQRGRGRPGPSPLREGRRWGSIRAEPGGGGQSPVTAKDCGGVQWRRGAPRGGGGVARGRSLWVLCSMSKESGPGGLTSQWRLPSEWGTGEGGVGEGDGGAAADGELPGRQPALEASLAEPRGPKKSCGLGTHFRQSLLRQTPFHRADANSRRPTGEEGSLGRRSPAGGCAGIPRPSPGPALSLQAGPGRAPCQRGGRRRRRRQRRQRGGWGASGARG